MVRVELMRVTGGDGLIQRTACPFGSPFLPGIAAVPPVLSTLPLRFTMPLLTLPTRQPAPLVRRFCLVSLLLSALLAPPVLAQENDMFPTKAAALKRAKELKCSGAFVMGNDWMPCRDFATYQHA
ncbi:MAG: hypothetical protein VKP63_10595, partial [Cyanobacteriota bacterium]|nr:hypothetical protein [Cyanobacteriota bacterium]